jgi:two-component system, sensor histidine kinase LadS
MACAWPTAQAQPVTLQAPERSMWLPTAVSAFDLPATQTLDPEVIWQQNQSTSQPANPQGLWVVNSGVRTVAKFSLAVTAESLYTLEVPTVRIDRVEVFWRMPGQAWRSAVAGDTVPLSQWPLIGQFPTAMLRFDSAPASADVIVVMQNAGYAKTPVIINSDRESRERRLLQANTAGLLIGASAMVTLMSILMMVNFLGRSAVYLTLYCAAITLGTSVISGYAAIWFTGEMTYFNDASKPFVASCITATMLLASMSALDRGFVGVKGRRLVYIMAALVLGYAVLQITLLPFEWRLFSSVGGATVSVLVVWFLAYRAWLRGDRYAAGVALAALMYMGSVLVVGMGYAQLAGLDIFASLLMVFLLISSLILRYVIVARERYGRAVMGRAATNRYRDPLTALLSFKGFEREVDNLSLRQNSGGGLAHVLYFHLTELDSFKNEDGHEVWQRDMVRFAAVLQRALGEDWNIARLSTNKFGAVRLDEADPTSSEPLLTLILSNCVRKIDTYGWVDRVGLRMASVHTTLSSSGLEESLRIMEHAVENLDYGKRIALL